jgi:D-amino-acid dehydrogenase
MSIPTTVIVIGGGLVGCSAAYYLAKRGWQVRLLERDQLGSGASSGNCGYVCPSHVLPLATPGAVGSTLRTMMRGDSPIAVRMPPSFGLLDWSCRFMSKCNQASMERASAGRHALLVSSMQLYRELIASEAMNCQWQDRGLLLVFSSAKEYDAYGATAAVLRDQYGIAMSEHSGEAVRALDPALRTGLAGGWLCEGDSHLHPGKLLSAFRSVLEGMGVEIIERVAVERIVVDRGRVMRLVTSAGDESADAYVLATGVNSPVFAKTLGCTIPIQPGKGYSLTMPAVAGGPTRPMIFEEHHVAVTPFDGQVRIGSTMELGSHDLRANPKRLALLMKSARAHLAVCPDADGVEPWVGLRPMTYDDLPCIDRSPAASNMIVAAGHGMIGVSTAPATGLLAAEMLSGDQPHLDVQPYRLSRF